MSSRHQPDRTRDGPPASSTSAAAPTVYRVGPQRLALSSIRLGLGALGFAASTVTGAEADAAGVGLALGAGVACLALLTDRRWLLLGRPTVAPLPEGAHRVRLSRSVASGMLPSTAGVAVLAAVSLAFEPILASLLAGILAGMGIVSLASWVEVVLWERREGAGLFADADVHTRRYVAPLAQPSPTPASGGK